MDWPTPPIWPHDLDDIRELLTDEEWRELLRRQGSLWPLEAATHPKAPNAAWRSGLGPLEPLRIGLSLRGAVFLQRRESLVQCLDLALLRLDLALLLLDGFK